MSYFYTYVWLKHIRSRLIGTQALMGRRRYKQIAQRLQEMKFGQMVLGGFFFVINMTTMLKVFDAPAWLYIIALPFTAFSVWFVGWWMEQHGVRQYFREAEFKDVELMK